MLARVRRRGRGLGDIGFGSFSIFTPGACGLTDLGILKGECWALSLGPRIVGQDTYTAALAVQSPDVAYPTQALPPAPAAVTDYGFPATGAGSAEQAQAAVDAAIADAKARANQQNINYFSQVGQALDTAGQASAPVSSLVKWGLIGAGIFAGVLLLKR